MWIGEISLNRGKLYQNIIKKYRKILNIKNILNKIIYKNIKQNHIKKQKY